MKVLFFAVIFSATAMIVHSQVDSLNVDSFMLMSSGKSYLHNNSKHFFLENRNGDTLNIGYITQEKYEGNFISDIKPGYPLNEQFIELLDSFTDAKHDNRKLLLQLSRLRFGDLKKGSNKKEGLMFRANLYDVSEKGYCRIGSIDTLAAIKASNNKRFILNCFKKARNIIHGFINTSLSKTVDATCQCVSLEEIKKIDSLQKSSLRLYIVDTLSEGVYKSYQSFRDQQPDLIEFNVRMKDDVPEKVERLNVDPQNMSYSPGKVYAVVVNNTAFIYDNSSYYMLQKRENDFFFKRKVRWIDSDSYFPFFAPVGIQLIAFTVQQITDDKGAETVYEIKLDHIDGSFTPVKMIR